MVDFQVKDRVKPKDHIDLERNEFENELTDKTAAKFVVIVGCLILLAFGLLVGGCTYWLIHTFGG